MTHQPISPMKQQHSPTLRGLIMDMDGVVYRDDQPIGSLPEVFAVIDQRGLDYTLVTNNATMTVEDIAQKLKRMGALVSTRRILNSPDATAIYLQHIFPGGAPVFVVGETGLHESLHRCGFTHDPERAKAVVVGLDRTLTYEKLAEATLLIRAGALFVATNPDHSYITPRGQVPGGGAIVALLEVASGVQPVVVGKPNPEMYRVALGRMNLQPAEVLVVGDRLETDIAGAQALGCRTALVLSGVTDRDAALAWRPALDYVANDLTSLLQSL